MTTPRATLALVDLIRRAPSDAVALRWLQHAIDLGARGAAAPRCPSSLPCEPDDPCRDCCLRASSSL